MSTMRKHYCGLIGEKKISDIKWSPSESCRNTSTDEDDVLSCRKTVPQRLRQESVMTVFEQSIIRTNVCPKLHGYTIAHLWWCSHAGKKKSLQNADTKMLIKTLSGGVTVTEQMTEVQFGPATWLSYQLCMFLPFWNPKTGTHNVKTEIISLPSTCNPNHN